MKICNKCKIEKNEDDFIWRKFYRRYTSHCKVCIRNYQNEYYKLHPRKTVNNRNVNNRKYPNTYRFVKARRERIKKLYGFGGGSLGKYGLPLLLEVYSKFNYSCDHCRTKEKLTIHHRDGKGYRNKQLTGEKVNNNIDNLQVLCRSCHGHIEGIKSAIFMGKKINSNNLSTTS